MFVSDIVPTFGEVSSYRQAPPSVWLCCRFRHQSVKKQKKNCGSELSSDWIPSAQSMPCCYSLLSNVLDPLYHPTTPEGRWRTCWWFLGYRKTWFIMCECVLGWWGGPLTFLHLCLNPENTYSWLNWPWHEGTSEECFTAEGASISSDKRRPTNLTL